MPLTFNDRYRKDLKYQPGHGYGRDVAPKGQKPIWVAERSGGVSSIVIHATHGNPGSAATAEAEYLFNSPNVSATYLIGRDLVIYRLLPDGMVAWHAGRVLPEFDNDLSIGIEIHAAKNEKILPGQHALLTALVREKIAEHQIPRSLLDTHRAVARPVGRKSDPAMWLQADFIVWRESLYTSAPQAYTEDSTIFGEPRVSEQRVLDFILAKPHGEYTKADLEKTIIPTYFRVCADVGVDPLIAIAQMLHETGNMTSFWAARPQRNPAGIGVNGDVASSKRGPNWAFNGMVWVAGNSFLTWDRHAIPAQVGRLLAYALPQGEGTEAQQKLIVQALSYRSLPDKVRGSAPTLKQLGKAHNPSGEGWADPGTDYGKKIAEKANALLGG